MCTETKDARVHCTILNDHTNRGRTPPTGEAGPDRPSETTPPTPQGSDCPLRTQQCAAGLPTTEKTGLSGVSTFLEQPPPTPGQTSRSRPGRYWGPPPHHHSA